jgi:hypothetical protein
VTAAVLVLAYLALAAGMGAALVHSFRKHGLLDEGDAERFRRARVLVVTLALCWPSTLVLAAVVSTERGYRTVLHLIGGGE